MMKDVFGKMFDMDRDGELDPVEREMEYDFMYRPSERHNNSRSKSELDDWDFMDSDERRDALEDLGLDSDDFDDYDDFDSDF